VVENERRLAEARRQDEAGERHLWEDVEFLCECSDPDCSAVVRVDAARYANAHEHRQGLYFVTPDHVLWNVEAVQPHFTLGSTEFKVIEAPRPEIGNRWTSRR